MELQVGFKYWEYFKLTLKGFIFGGWVVEGDNH